MTTTASTDISYHPAVSLEALHDEDLELIDEDDEVLVPDDPEPAGDEAGFTDQEVAREFVAGFDAAAIEFEDESGVAS